LDPCQLQDSSCALPLQLVNAVVDHHAQAWRLVSAVVDRQLEEKVAIVYSLCELWAKKSKYAQHLEEPLPQ
jgi:hypothetical protein